MPAIDRPTASDASNPRSRKSQWRRRDETSTFDGGAAAVITQVSGPQQWRLGDSSALTSGANRLNRNGKRSTGP